MKTRSLRLKDRVFLSAYVECVGSLAWARWDRPHHGWAPSHNACEALSCPFYQQEAEPREVQKPAWDHTARVGGVGEGLPHTVPKGQAPCPPAQYSLPQPNPLLLTGTHSAPRSPLLWGQTQHDCLGLPEWKIHCVVSPRIMRMSISGNIKRSSQRPLQHAEIL